MIELNLIDVEVFVDYIKQLIYSLRARLKNRLTSMLEYL
jgi:hypothetical protein